MPYSDLLRKSWDRAIRRLDLPADNPHGLRHKWTTVALTNGVSIHEVSRWLGHRSIKVTVDRYGHLTQDGQQRCRQIVETAVGPHILMPGRASAARDADLGLAWPASRCSRLRPYRF
ncbi:tyrosine-type recombinase/integrase [Streptomyces sp. NPDC001930]|uniref:tyrosine-type recombinase/integrase n=1 Tax=Streptomyces sp. NPDC001930 TaxID=3364625 RepID=UPI0036AC8323